MASCMHRVPMKIILVVILLLSIWTMLVVVSGAFFKQQNTITDTATTHTTTPSPHRQQSPSFKPTSTISMKSKSDTPYPEIPSLVLIGAAKTGTRSLIDALSEFPDNVQYESERHFWSGSKDYSCRPWYSEVEWTRFIGAFTSQSINFSVTMTRHILDHSNNTKCTVYRYQQRWRGRRVKDVLPPQCMFNEDGLTPCYLMEKGPSYINSPWVAALFPVTMPRVKVLGIIRNPVHHVWSCYFAFGRIMDAQNKRFESDRRRIEMYILNRFNGSSSFNALRNLTMEINTAWDVLSWSGMDRSQRHGEMMRLWYPKLMALYLELRFVSPRDILVTLRRDAFLWFPMASVNVLFWMYCYEEMGITEQFRVSQSEWIFKDIQKASQEIQCWLRNEDRHCEVAREFESRSDLKNHAMYDEGPGPRFIKRIKWYFDPFKATLLHLMRDRKDLRLGKWVKWDPS